MSKFEDIREIIEQIQDITTNLIFDDWCSKNKKTIDNLELLQKNVYKVMKLLKEES